MTTTPSGSDRFSGGTGSMRIGIDGRPLAGRLRGVGRYVTEICRELDHLLPASRFFVYGRQSMAMPIPSRRWTARTDPSAIGRRLSPLAWLKLRCAGLAERDDLDVFWGTNLFLPTLGSRTRSVVTVYDLSFDLVPETYHRTHLWALRRFAIRDLARADVLTTCSQGTADRLHRRLGVKTTAVISPTVSSHFRPRLETEVQPILRALGVKPPYLLTVATWEPRKNLAGLLRAWHSLGGDGEAPGFTLVLVGRKSHKYRRETELLTADGGRRVLDLGYVPDDHLPALYSGAEALVFPSSYEGFGMPVLEARACGTPVVTTDIPELREAGGEDALYVEPTVAGIRQGILDVLALGRRPRPLADPPDWHDRARIMAELLTA